MTWAGKRLTLLDESYNANPTSMGAAISLLGAYRAAPRRLAVLGDMFELGKDELAHHAGLAAPLMDANVARVIVAGECMRALRGAMPRPMRGAWARDHLSALAALREEVMDGDVILFKGSNSMKLSYLVSTILAEGDTHAI